MRAVACVSLAAAGVSGCSSSMVSSSAAKPNGPAEMFSAELNSTSVFVGASIIHYWALPLHNDGIAGQTSSEVLARFKADVAGHGYARVIVLCGTNDVLQKTPDLVAELTANLKSMDQIAKEAGIPVVLSELPPASSGGVNFDATIAAVNAAIVQMGAQQGDVVVDYYSPMLGHPEYFADGVHPNATGYAVMERALSAAVVR